MSFWKKLSIFLNFFKFFFKTLPQFLLMVDSPLEQLHKIEKERTCPKGPDLFFPNCMM
jgi:hypothetical protein